jgi:hypothetical protein
LSPSALRWIGLLCIIVAAVPAILNLKRVANAGTFWVSMPLLIIGIFWSNSDEISIKSVSTPLLIVGIILIGRAAKIFYER